MTNPLPQDLAEDLHAVSFGEGVSCDYHHRPKEISTNDAVLVETIRLIDHPQLQLDQWPENWHIDAARCADHSVEEIEEPTRGFEEALVEVPVQRSNNVVSVDVPHVNDIRVLAFEPATEGCPPMLLDQQLMDASEPGDMGFSRWSRVHTMVSGGPAEPFKTHIESLIERSAEVPSSLEK